MQVINGILKISSGAGEWVLSEGIAAPTPTVTMGIRSALRIDLRQPYVLNTSYGALPPYDASELSGLSLRYAMDADYDATTIPPFHGVTDAVVQAGADGGTYMVLTLPDTNTTAIRTALAARERISFRVEVVGTDGDGDDVFCVDFELQMKNRVYADTPGDDAPEGGATASPSWMAAVRAAIQEELASSVTATVERTSGGARLTVTGPSGVAATALVADGAPGAPGDPGDPGGSGPANSLSVGTVEMVPANASPEVTITGTPPSQVLNFKIPRGYPGADGTPMLMAFNSVASASDTNWHSTVNEGDRYYRYSADGGVTWSGAISLRPGTIVAVTRFAADPQDDAAIVWRSPSTRPGQDYAVLAAGSCYFRVRIQGQPWTEGELLTERSRYGTAEALAAQEALLAAEEVRVQFAASGDADADWHAAPQAGDTHLRFFNVTGTARYVWDFSGYGETPFIQEVQTADRATAWHDTPTASDRWMKVSTDAGDTWTYFAIRPEGITAELPPSDGKLYAMRNGAWTEIAAGASGQGGEAASGTVYYGYVSDGVTYRVADVTASMLGNSQGVSSASLAEIQQPLRIASVPAGAVLVVAVPDGFTASKDDGLGGRAAFATNNGASGTGANGVSITIDGEDYLLYGEFVLAAADFSIYIEED